MPTIPTPRPQAAAAKLPLCYFAFGLLCLAVFGVILPFYAKEVLAQHHYTHYTVALTHLLVLGYAATIVIGAALQMAPMTLGVKLHSERLGAWILGFHLTGVVGMVACFWFWNFQGLLWFGILLTAGFGLFFYNIFRTLGKVGRHDLVSIHIGAATGHMALTLLAGQYLIHDKVILFSKFPVLSAIHAHAHLAAVGWFVMMIMGVSYRLIPMFIFSSVQSPRRAWASFFALNAGILGVFVGILLDQGWLPLAVACLGAGLGLWLLEMRAIFRERKRPNLDDPLKLAQTALGHLPILFLIGLWLAWPDREPSLFKSQAQTGYGILGLLGLVSLFVMAMLYKIIPFLVWHQIYPPLVGRQPVPQLRGLYFAGLEKWGGRLMTVGIWLTAAASAFAYHLPVWSIQAAAGILGVGILMNVFNLWVPLSRLVLRQGCPLAGILAQFYRWRREAREAAAFPSWNRHGGQKYGR